MHAILLHTNLTKIAKHSKKETEIITVDVGSHPVSLYQSYSDSELMPLCSFLCLQAQITIMMNKLILIVILYSK